MKFVGARRVLFFALLLSLLIMSFAAADSQITVVAIDNTIKPSESASFRIEIKNLESQQQRYSIYSLQSGQGWNVDPSPLSDKIVELGVGEKRSVIINAQPLEDFPPGIYNIFVTVESDRGERYDQKLKIYLAPEQPLDYRPTIRAAVDMPEKIDPREAVSIKLFVENRNPLNLRDLRVIIESEIPEFSKEVAIDLPPLGQKTVEFSVEPNPFQQPKEYTLFFVFKRDEETVNVVQQKIEILPLVPGFSLDVSEEKKFFKIFTTIKMTNTGNVRNTQEVSIPISAWRALFTAGDGEVRTIDEKRSLVWGVTLGPNETTTVQFVTNYRLLFYILAILAFFAVFSWAVRSPIVVTKRAVTAKSAEDGGLSEIKISLDVRNRASKPLRDVVIIDHVPAIANVQKSLELGTLKPVSVTPLKQGTKVIWSLAELDGQEHRIITYKLKAKLQILGSLQLPRATVEYKKKGRKRMGKAYSNVFRLGA